jgi:hypothetical protein
MNRIALVHAIAKVPINSDLFSFFQNFRHPNWRNVVLDDFETLVREIDVRALVLQYHPGNICTSAQTTISRTSASKCPATA